MTEDGMFVRKPDQGMVKVEIAEDPLVIALAHRSMIASQADPDLATLLATAARRIVNDGSYALSLLYGHVERDAFAMRLFDVIQAHGLIGDIAKPKPIGRISQVH